MSSSPGTLRGGSIIKIVPSPYSQEQVYQYLDRIAYPGAQEYNATKSHRTSLENLTVLMRHHLIAFPFENTAMHYTLEHAMDVSPEGIFNRLVVDRIGGSYCFGQNSFLLGILRGLGYRVHAGTARVNSVFSRGGAPQYTALSHAVLFVQPIEGSKQTYVVDVGFGSPGLARPILLAEGVPSPGAMAPEMHVLTRVAHPDSSVDCDSDSSHFHRLWRLEMYHEGNPEVHQLLYTFSEQEAYPIDFENGSFVVSQKPGSIFGDNVLACRTVRLSDDTTSTSSNHNNQRSTTPQKSVVDDNPKPLVRYTLFGGQVKRIAGAESTVIRELTSESQRIQALREVFGLKIPDEAEKYIQGRVPAFNSAKGD